VQLGMQEVTPSRFGSEALLRVSELVRSCCGTSELQVHPLRWYLALLAA